MTNVTDIDTIGKLVHFWQTVILGLLDYLSHYSHFMMNLSLYLEFWVVIIIILNGAEGCCYR